MGFCPRCLEVHGGDEDPHPVVQDFPALKRTNLKKVVTAKKEKEIGQLKETASFQCLRQCHQKVGGAGGEGEEEA